VAVSVCLFLPSSRSSLLRDLVVRLQVLASEQPCPTPLLGAARNSFVTPSGQCSVGPLHRTNLRHSLKFVRPFFFPHPSRVLREEKYFLHFFCRREVFPSFSLTTNDLKVRFFSAFSLPPVSRKSFYLTPTLRLSASRTHGVLSSSIFLSWPYTPSCAELTLPPLPSFPYSFFKFVLAFFEGCPRFFRFCPRIQPKFSSLSGME